VVDIDKLNELANRHTWYRMRMEAMGFKFTKIEVAESFFSSDEIMLRASFLCVCGNPEMLHVLYPRDTELYFYERELDPAMLLFRGGSFKAAHLRADGYSEEAIAGILARDPYSPDNLAEARRHGLFDLSVVDKLMATRFDLGRLSGR